MDGAGNEAATAMSDASPQRRSRRRDKQPESAGSDSELKKERSSKSTRSKKRRSPPQASDDENQRDDKKVKTEQVAEGSKRTRAVTARTASASAAKKTQADDEGSSDHGGTSDGDTAQPRVTSRAGRARRPASQKVIAKPAERETIKEEPKSRRREPKQSAAAARARDASPELHPSRGNEVDFGVHLARHHENQLMTFDISTKALLETLRTAKHIELAAENIQICAECRGGGDLLCCDCCPLAFHPDCLEPLERPSSMYVPIAKHGLKAASRRAEEDLKEGSGGNREPLCLKEAEWYCPYCMAAPIQRYWKRGVPQFLTLLSAGGGGGAGGPTTAASGDECDMAEPSAPSQNAGNVIQWMEEVTKFVNEPLHSTDTFPPRILLALAGIRRAIQRHGALYNMLSKRESEVRAEMEQASMAEVSPDTPPLSDEGMEQAEPDVKAEVAAKPHIMGRRTTTTTGTAATGGVKQKSDEDTNAAELDQPRRSTRRAQVLENRRAKKEEVQEDIQGVQAKVNVGASFQVPGVNKHFLEAKEFGLNYMAMDRQSVIQYLPRDHLGRVPIHRMATASTCRLVFSATELEKRRQDGGKDHIPLSERDLTEYVHKAVALWPVWIQWPPTQEFALKLLHHCRYDTEAALRLLCSDALQFRAVCDPPVKPYMNKWKPRDKRGHLPSVPFPPPSNALSLMGVPDLGLHPIP